MITTTIFPGRYVQGYDALQSLGGRGLAIGSTYDDTGGPVCKGKLVRFVPACC